MARRACSCCRLPAALRHEVEDQGLRRHVPVRAISSWLTEQGHPRSRDTVHRHLTLCQPQVPATEPVTAVGGDHAQVPALLVALAAADVLRNFESLANRLAVRLNVDGMHDAAQLVLSHVTREYRPSLTATAGTEVHELLAARVLARAVGAVLATRAPEVSREIAQHLHSLGADQLASDFLVLAERAAALHPVPTTPLEAHA